MLTKVAISKVAPEKLVCKVRETELGKLANELGELAYNVYERDGKVLVGGNEKQIKSVLYAAQEALEQVAMREILNQYFG